MTLSALPVAAHAAHAAHHATVGRDAHIAPRSEGGTVKTVPYSPYGRPCPAALSTCGRPRSAPPATPP